MMDPSRVIEAVCAFHEIAYVDLTGPGKTPQICWPRHELIRLLNTKTTCSIMAIGRLVGGRDSSTVRASLNQVQRRVTEDLAYAEHFWRLERFVASYEIRPSAVTALTRARRLIGKGANDAPADAEACGIALLTAATILGSPELSDAEARRAALLALGQTAA
ncbi:hypothetical protein D2T29_19785 [Sinirhodobacter populi]|uniref:Chromosomal replication initiator DnaA C-terminal domain-containing protein n=1 Tax=Paenirhodobacter populi TaxID=2306993 RepID=A0A443K229_9RHOB|nr:helix-turn-helix domain-containing protein [Sinirhodobacter populi]RWR26821.1 hypothetical protein D2T29_19785 [Sinirhodobacter populi]